TLFPLQTCNDDNFSEKKPCVPSSQVLDPGNQPEEYLEPVNVPWPARNGRILFVPLGTTM
ncbi:MAG: hypothetical protein EA399_12340, partial [Desulfovibrionales bacterium]